MPNWLERIAAHLAFLHADRVLGNFMRALRAPEAAQQRALQRALRVLQSSDYARQRNLHLVRTPDDLRRAVPLQRYANIAPLIEKVAAGETRTLFAHAQSPRMFATSSGTTDRQKLIPVTPAFVDDYRRGWNIFGLKVLRDHPAAILRGILQVTGRHDERHSPAGVPIGAITGLLARAQKPIVRHFYVTRPEIAHIADPNDRYYTLARFAVARDVAFAVTANPATLIRVAQTADQDSERLIRDVHDGTLSIVSLGPGSLRKQLTRRLRPNRIRARQLATFRAHNHQLRPADYWNMAFIACWIGGSMSHYRDHLMHWYGPLPVRDLGLLASEGRITIALEDERPCGVLDVTAGLFEFIPAEQFERENPACLFAHELELGRDYAVVLSNTTGLLRYRLDDIVRVVSQVGRTPVLEFRYRGGRVASVAGEKVTEDQVVIAMTKIRQQINLEPFDFVMAPVWDDPPYYRVSTPAARDGLSERLDSELSQINSEYASRRASARLAPLRLRPVPSTAIDEMDRRALATRGSTAEQYKRQVLFCQPGEDDQALGLEK